MFLASDSEYLDKHLTHDQVKDNEPRIQSFRRDVLRVSIGDIDHFTLEHILQTFPSRQEWCQKHLDPIWMQIREWWRTVFVFEAGIDLALMEEMALTDLVRHTLCRTGFAILPEDAYEAHEAWHTLMPHFLKSVKEVPRTRGFLSLLFGEIISYERLWRQFWGTPLLSSR